VHRIAQVQRFQHTVTEITCHLFQLCNNLRPIRMCGVTDSGGELLVHSVPVGVLAE
jgi:hypothetical protein